MIKICPNCNRLPEVKEQRCGLRYQCTIYCPNIGCSYFYPIVEVNFNKQKAFDKAVELWNARIKE